MSGARYALYQIQLTGFVIVPKSIDVYRHGANSGRLSFVAEVSEAITPSDVIPVGRSVV
jgi:hypothetical protein